MLLRIRSGLLIDLSSGNNFLQLFSLYYLNIFFTDYSDYAAVLTDLKFCSQKWAAYSSEHSDTGRTAKHFAVQAVVSLKSPLQT